jgi:Zn-dependent peptidase ImmA (M78 family)
MSKKTREKKLHKWLKYWKGRLRIRDWEIQLRFCYTDLDIPGLHGINHYDYQHKESVIYIDMDAPLEKLHFFLIHELLHLPLDFVISEGDDTNVNTDREEFAINTLATALLALYKENEKLKKTINNNKEHRTQEA